MRNRVKIRKRDQVDPDLDYKQLLGKYSELVLENETLKTEHVRVVREYKRVDIKCGAFDVLVKKLRAEIKAANKALDRKQKDQVVDRNYDGDVVTYTLDLHIDMKEDGTHCIHFEIITPAHRTLTQEQVQGIAREVALGDSFIRMEATRGIVYDFEIQEDDHYKVWVGE